MAEEGDEVFEFGLELGGAGDMGPLRVALADRYRGNTLFTQPVAPVSACQSQRERR